MAYVLDITINGILNLVAKARPLDHLSSPTVVKQRIVL